MFLNGNTTIFLPLKTFLNRKHEMFLNKDLTDPNSSPSSLTVNMKCF